MRNQRAGQATFIPLDTIQVKPVNDKFRSFAKGARLAVDVISCDAVVERAVHHACGNALVCDTMEVARYVCYEKGQEIKGGFGVLLIWVLADVFYSGDFGGYGDTQEWSYHGWKVVAEYGEEVG